MGVGSNNLCLLWPLCVYLDLGPENFFSCVWTSKPMAGSWVPTPGTPSRPPPPPYGPLLMWSKPFQAVQWHLKITSQRWLHQSQAGLYLGENAAYPPPLLGFFGPIHIPYLKGLNRLFAYPTSRG